jgi:hypothetical protein
MVWSHFVVIVFSIGSEDFVRTLIGVIAGELSSGAPISVMSPCRHEYRYQKSVRSHPTCEVHWRDNWEAQKRSGLLTFPDCFVIVRLVLFHVRDRRSWS